MRALPAQELYFALLEIGTDDAAELVAMAAPHSSGTWWTWRRGAPPTKARAGEVLHWLHLAREGGDDPLRFRAQLRALDVELLALLLRRQVLVHDLVENEEEPNPADPALAFYTPDRRFLLEFNGSAELATHAEADRGSLRRGPVRGGPADRGRALGAAHRAGGVGAPLARRAAAGRGRARLRRGHLLLCAARRPEGRAARRSGGLAALASRQGRCWMRRSTSSRATSWSAPRRR